MLEEGSGHPPLRVVEYSKFAHATYMLDYTIWAYLKNGASIESLKKKLGAPAIYSNTTFQKATRT
jgi:hypothetical protein